MKNNFGQEITVEIIPWIHDIRTQSQGGVIEFINRLPQGSKLFIEGDQKSIDTLLDLSYVSFDHQVKALYELLLTCKQKKD